MFKTIVLGLDGSEHADRTIPIARDLAHESGGKIVVVHVREIVPARGGAHPVRVDEAEIQAKVESQVEELRAAGADATLQMCSAVFGGPAQEIANTATEANADLIVVGTRGHSAIANVFLGGVTQRLLHVAHCPVLAVPPAAGSHR